MSAPDSLDERLASTADRIRSERSLAHWRREDGKVRDATRRLAAAIAATGGRFA